MAKQTGNGCQSMAKMPTLIPFMPMVPYRITFCQPAQVCGTDMHRTAMGASTAVKIRQMSF